MDPSIFNPLYEIAVKALVTVLLTLAATGVAYLNVILRQRLTAEQYKIVEKTLGMIVRGVTQEFSNESNETKFAAALARARLALEAKGLKVDEVLLRTWVESAYHSFKEQTLSDYAFHKDVLVSLPKV